MPQANPFRWSLASLVPSLFLVAVSGCQAPDDGVDYPEGSWQRDGRVFGMPEARVFQEDYDGAPVVGDHLTRAPRVSPLDYEGNRVHEVRIDTFVREIEIEEGNRFRAWTFGGTVPGPVLTVREGDLVRFTMRNRSNEEVAISEPGAASPFLEDLASDSSLSPAPAVFPMAHSMDFHAGAVAADDKWRTIVPGQSIEFEWVANYPGVYMYHCGTPSVLMHTAMGQYGTVIVLPREGYPDEADHEFALVQSEFYLGERGPDGVRPYDHEAASNREPTVVAFNGHRARHLADPLEVTEGDRVRLYVMNAGPNEISSFHVIGAIFDKVYPEGNLENLQVGMQTVTLGASQGSVLEFVVPEAGEYHFVDHTFAHPERGAVGHILAAPRTE